MLQLEFQSIKELEAGSKWRTLFNKHWPAYRKWFQSKGAFEHTDLFESQEALKKYMPLFYDTYVSLCKLAGDSVEAKRFLTGYNPPAYISGCSQFAFAKEPMLIRNYDYHPYLSEGTLLLSQWHKQKVIAVGDCLWGAVDGMNSSGIAISLTFGGSKINGPGFGIPFILRYVLEFATSVDEAVNFLTTIPSHMAYNVAVLDKQGKHRVVMVSPDKEPIVLNTCLSTNHQQEITWPEHAAFSKTVERENFLKTIEKDKDSSREQIIELFLKKPLFSERYSEGFGTVYTSVYKILEGSVELHWANDQVMMQSFENFTEQSIIISFGAPARGVNYADRPDTVATPDFAPSYSSDQVFDTINVIMESIKYIPGLDIERVRAKVEQMEAGQMERGGVPWEAVADFWSEFGKSFVNAAK